MRAQYREDGTIAVSGTARIETFTRVWAGIGWPERDPGHLCVVGEKTDGRYHALWEQTGGLWELGEAAVHAKDRFLVESFWVDGRDGLATSYLRTLNGLCFHEPAAPYNPPRRGMWFQARTERRMVPEIPPATVRSAPERVIDHFRSALEKTRGVLMKGQILIHEVNCPKLTYTIRQPLDDLLQAPAMKALVWVVTALEDGKGCETPADVVSGPWYANFSRDRG